MLKEIKADLYVLVGLNGKKTRNVCVSKDKEKIISAYENDLYFDDYEIEMYVLENGDYVFYNITSIERLKKEKEKNELNNN